MFRLRRPRSTSSHATSLFVVASGVVALVAIGGCRWLDDRPGPTAPPPPYTAAARAHAPPLYTPARPTFFAAGRDFLGIRPSVTQPIEFPHNVHTAKGITCTEMCHEAVTRGPQAGLPGVNTCMVCHAGIATDKPLIRQIADMEQKGLDLAWQRVFSYSSIAHLRFNHAPHIRAKVECSTCHGDIAHQTVARRNVVLTMGDCVTCHRQNNAKNDCVTCHY
jgi:hypothetical protein